MDVEDAQDGPWKWVSGEALALCTPRFHTWGAGLMLEGSSPVNRVLCMTFLSEPLLEQALARGAGTLVFTHHPMDLEGEGPGFVAISHQILGKLKEVGVSIYCAHAPLDAANNPLSTGAALARIARVTPKGYFAPYPIKPAGIFGTPLESDFDGFCRELQGRLGVSTLHVIRNNDRREIGLLGIVPGGGGNAEDVAQAASLGCDTYLTGHVENRVALDFVIETNRRFKEKAAELGVNLIGASHYASESVAVRGMVDYFRALGLEAEFVVDGAKGPWD